MKKTLEMIKNTILSICAVLLLNGVIQFAVYPILSKKLGAASFGDVLVILGAVGIVAPAAGLAVNNTRLMARKNGEVSNGDSGLALLLLLIPSILCVIAYAHSVVQISNLYIELVLLIVASTLRYYSDVEYRLNLKYNQYFVYYLIISIGYILGIIIFPITKSWALAVTLGEVLGTVYVIIFGTIYKRVFKISDKVKQFIKDCIILWFSYLLYNAVLNLDRVLVKHLMDSTMVTVFYVSSLLGKMIAMLVGPLNSITISYLSKYEEGINRKNYLKIVVAAFVVGMAFYFVTCVVTPIFAKIAYSEIYNQVVQYAPLANLSQIICFIGSFMMTIILTLASNKWQVIIQVVFTILFLTLSSVLFQFYGMTGFIAGILLANIIRLVMTIIIGFRFTASCDK